MNDQNNISPLVIFSGSMWEAGMVQSLLADAEIESFLNESNRSGYYPHLIDSEGTVKVVVSNKDAEHAIQIVEEYKKNVGRD